jgi:hypothetical protein
MLKKPVMETQDMTGNAGEKENQENMGIPERKREQLKENLDAEQESLPSDGPVSQSEGTTAPDLDSNLERDDPADLRQDSSPV